MKKRKARVLRRKPALRGGKSITVAGRTFPARTGVQLRPDTDVELANGDAPSEWMLLQGRPIGEPVVQHGPFVMNTQAEIHQAFSDYQRTKFGGWPWPSDEPVHPKEQGRFARHPAGADEAP